MKCCNCKHSELEPKELERGLLAACCPHCHGALLPLMNYRYWSEHTHEVSNTETNLEIAQEPAAAKQCPKCRGMMTKYRIGPSTQNRLELCDHCDEVWLDAGEWTLVKKLDLHNKLSSVFTQAWQRNIRKQKEADNIRKHYEQLLGVDDFSKIQTFKQWLDQHNKRSDISHYLNTKFD